MKGQVTLSVWLALVALAAVFVGMYVFLVSKSALLTSDSCSAIFKNLHYHHEWMVAEHEVF